jgi:hypothetical protein
MKSLITTLMLGFSIVWATLAFAQEQPIALGSLAYQKTAALEAWHPAGIVLEGKNNYQVKGNGRIFFHSLKSGARVQVGRLLIKPKAGTLGFIDQVGPQARVMILRGKASAIDGLRVIPLASSMQLTVSPEGYKGYFINDGVYRRPPVKEFNEQGLRVWVRQFYVEHAVYSDPILRALYQENTYARKLIDRINKTAAALRDLNGTKDYEAGQV